MTGPIQNEASRLILEGTSQAEPGTFTHTASPENDVLINEGAARTLIHLAITNGTPAWTRTPNWGAALLAFKIHFGDRLPN